MDELLEIENERTLTREEAAAWLADLARQLGRSNSLQLRQDGLKYTVKVPGEVGMEVEVEIGEEGSKIEIEISW